MSSHERSFCCYVCLFVPYHKDGGVVITVGEAYRQRGGGGETLAVSDCHRLDHCRRHLDHVQVVVNGC